MPTRLIINADDFGLTEGVNRSIAQLSAAGALSSTSLMATGNAFSDAVGAAERQPTLGVGCHVVLTDGVPISDPAHIPSLLGPDRRSFRPSLASFASAALLGRLNGAEIELECEAQVRRLQQAGVVVTHLDTHKHTHLFPAVLRPLLCVARCCSIGAVRNPFEPPWSVGLGHAAALRRWQIRLLGSLRKRFLAEIAHTAGAVTTTDGTIGVSATGHLNGVSLRELLDALPEGTWELVCHPGENDADLDRVTTRLRAHRTVEHDALRAYVPEWLRSHPGVSLIHFGDLAHAPEDVDATIMQMPEMTGVQGRP